MSRNSYPIALALFTALGWTVSVQWNALDLTLLWIVSRGVAYHGLRCTTLAADVRYFDYAGTKTLGEPPGRGESPRFQVERCGTAGRSTKT